MTYFAKATEAHKAALEAEKAFDDNPTLENAKLAYKLARVTLATGGTPYGENVVFYRVQIKTLALRAKALATPESYEPSGRVVNLTISGNKLVSLLNIVSMALHEKNYAPDHAEKIDATVECLRDLLAEQCASA
jgi:glucose-6-phosphate isomerase